MAEVPQGITRHILHDQLVAMYDKRAAAYDSETNASGEVWHLDLAKDLVQHAIPFIPSALMSPSKVLDLCCGTGMVACEAYEALGPETIVHGVDFSAKSIELAKEKVKGNPNFKFFVSSVTDLGSLGLEKRSYSLITCCSAFVLLENRLEVLKMWAEYLKPGGVLALDVTAAETQQVTDFMSHSLPAGSGIVDRSWITSESSLKELFVDAGYECEKVVLTPVYKTSEYKVADAGELFDKMIQAEVYKAQAENVSPVQGKEMKDSFVQMMKTHAGEDGILIDLTQLYIGIATKKD